MSKHRKSKSKTSIVPERVPLALAKALDSASDALKNNRPRAAIELLAPLQASYPRAAGLHLALGRAYLDTEELFSAAAAFRRALAIQPDRAIEKILASIYLRLDLTGLALSAFRRLQHGEREAEEAATIARVVADLEEGVASLAAVERLDRDKTEQALILLAEGQFALHAQDYTGSLTFNRRAIRIAGLWPPLLNNMSLAYFLSGNPSDAIGAAEQVLAADPHNIHALANLIRFLSFTGEVERARLLWKRLKAIQPQDEAGWRKLLQAAGDMDDDEAVYALFHESEHRPAGPHKGRDALSLAACLANTGRPGAEKALRRAAETIPWAKVFLDALKADRPGPGWASRYPYNDVQDLIPLREVETLFGLFARQNKVPEAKLRRETDRFAARFPQILLFGQKMILEMDQATPGIQLLALLGTPAAYAFLRSFALGQPGSEDARMEALMALQKSGQIEPGEQVKFWREGRWEDVELFSVELNPEPRRLYDPQVAGLIEQATAAIHKKRHDRAEQLLLRAIELDPGAAQAFLNLGAVHSYRNEPETAIQMYRQALAIDPDYVLARCNLAIHLLGQDDLQAAEEAIRPAGKIRRMTPQEAAMLGYTQARIALEREEIDDAIASLKLALQINPDFEPAKNLLQHLELVGTLKSGMASLIKSSRTRALQKRNRRRADLATADPPLRSVLEQYSKEQLTGMARQVLRYGGWSALKKAPLIDRLEADLVDADRLADLTAGLEPQEQAALGAVLAAGGALDWSAFDAAYGNDLEESPYWQWHEPKSAMGRLRLLGLLAESEVDGVVKLCVPVELRAPLRKILV